MRISLLVLLLVTASACALPVLTPTPSGTAAPRATTVVGVTTIAQAPPAASAPPTQSPQSPQAPAPSQLTPPTGTSTPDSAHATQGYGSGGLGLARSDWERTYGAGRPDGLLFVQYPAGYGVIFQHGNVEHIELRLVIGQEARLEDARTRVRQLSPMDARLVRSYTAANTGYLVDLFRSESLKDRFDPTVAMPDGSALSVWVGGQPGDFMAIYRQPADRGGGVSSIVLAIGNNP